MGSQKSSVSLSHKLEKVENEAKRHESISAAVQEENDRLNDQI